MLTTMMIGYSSKPDRNDDDDDKKEEKKNSNVMAAHEMVEGIR